MPSRVSIIRVLGLYSAAHVSVDTICAAVVFSITSTDGAKAAAFSGLLLLYHVLAFGLQPILGLGTDLAGCPCFVAVLGLALSSVALVLTPVPLSAIVVAGIGNALFHVGAGIICLGTTPGRSTGPGLFVAPGSLGLLFGAVLGSQNALPVVPLMLAALVLCTLMLSTQTPGVVARHRRGRQIGHIEMILGLLLLVITARSLMGFLVTFPWETQPISLFALTFASALGKACGGMLADRWGWIPLGVGATLASLPFLVGASTWPSAVIPGILLLNLAMPVTLLAVTESMPEYPGFAFGLTCLALLLGALPPLLGVAVDAPIVVALVIALSSSALYGGLRCLMREISPSTQRRAEP